MRLLLIGKSDAQAEAIRQCLANTGLEVECELVVTKAQFTEALLSSEWDVILSAYTADKFGALQALRVVDVHHLFVPLIVVDGTIGEEAVAQCLREGAWDYVSDARLDQLVRSVARALSDDAHRRGRVARDSQALMQSLMDHAPFAMSLRDVDGRFRLINQLGAEVLGHTPAHALNKSAAELFEQPVAEHLDAQETSVREGGPAVTFELKVHSPEGEERDCFVMKFPVRDSSQRLIGVGGISIDVTDQKRTERELRVAEAQFRGAFEEAPIGMALVAPSGRFVRVNPALRLILGYNEEELLDLTFQATTHPEDREADRVHSLRALAGEEQKFQVLKRHIHKDGQIVWVRLSASLVRDLEGRAVHFVAQLEDITAARDADLLLRETQAQLQALFEHAPVGLSLHDLDGRYLHINRFAAAALNETQPSTLIGRPLSEKVDDETAARVRRSDEQVTSSHEPATHEITLQRADGSYRDYHVVRYPVLDDHGEITAFGSFATDVTESKLTERAREQAVKELKEAQRISNLGSWSWDPQTRAAAWSPGMYLIFGLDPDHAALPIGSQFMAYIHPEDRERVAGDFARALVDGPEMELDFRIVRADGEERLLHAVGRGDEDRPGCYWGTVQDVTEREAERVVRAAEERFRLAFNNAPIGMALVHPDGQWLRVNKALCEMTGYEEEELLARTAQDITHPDDASAEQACTNDLLAGRRSSYDLEKRYVRYDGFSLWTLSSTSLVRDADGTPLYFVTQIQDISERKRFERDLRYMAEHDLLTGLANRRQLGDELDRRLIEQRRSGADLALVMLDLDHFKYVNDTHGHTVGDDVLRAAATALRARLRETDLIARLGGDEFAVVLPNTDADAAELVTRELLAGIREIRTPTKSWELSVTATAGIAIAHAGTPSANDNERLMTAADLAMYDAKEAGRDRYALHDPSTGSEARSSNRLNWSHRIRRALEHDSFVLHYQPILNLRADAPKRYEALVRMNDRPDGQLTGPTDFLDIAERYGLMPAIDRAVINRAITAIANKQLPPQARIAINLSASSLAADDLVADIEELLATKHVAAERLCFEITESAAIAKLENAQHFGETLRALGCDLALDDFGTGFGSFYHLKHLPYNYLKIDGAFIRGITHNHDDQALVKALVELARDTGKHTIAEYVGDRQTLELLRDLGVDYAQGFHIGRPTPAEQIAP